MTSIFNRLFSDLNISILNSIIWGNQSYSSYRYYRQVYNRSSAPEIPCFSDEHKVLKELYDNPYPKQILVYINCSLYKWYQSKTHKGGKSPSKTVNKLN